MLDAQLQLLQGAGQPGQSLSFPQRSEYPRLVQTEKSRNKNIIWKCQLKITDELFSYLLKENMWISRIDKPVKYCDRHSKFSHYKNVSHSV